MNLRAGISFLYRVRKLLADDVRARGQLADKGRHLIGFIRLQLTGLFDAAEYAAANCHDKIAPHAALGHWLRHGVREGRRPHKSPWNSWLMMKVASRELGVIAARGGRGLLNESERQNFAHKQGLDFNEYAFLAAYQAAEFSTAINFLQKTLGLFHLYAVHKSLRFMPAANDLKRAYEKAAELGPAIGLKERVMLRDLAFAAGRPWSDIATQNRAIASGFGGVVPLAEAFHTGLFPLEANVNGRDFTPYRKCYGPLIIAQDLAAKNACMDGNFISIQGALTSPEQSEADSNAVCIFVPEPIYFLSSDEINKSVCRAFLGIVSHVLAQGASVIFLPAPFARDLTHAKIPARRVISYHTFAAGRDDIRHYKESSIKRYFMIDKAGYSGASALAENPGTASMAGSENTERREWGKRRADLLRSVYAMGTYSKYEQPEGKSETQLPDDYVFVALQVPDDSVARWHFFDGFGFLDPIIDYYQGTSTQIVVKPHPKALDQASQAIIARLQETRGITVTMRPVTELIAGANTVITQNSGVGFEALLLGKPVLCAGMSEYAGGCLIWRSREEFAQANEMVLKRPEEVQSRADGFLADYFAHHSFFVAKSNMAVGLQHTDLARFCKGEI